VVVMMVVVMMVLVMMVEAQVHVGEPSRTCHWIDLHIRKTDGLLERLWYGLTADSTPNSH
jgi:hypothetical protein